MPVYQIPQQSRYIPTSTIFTATFNNPTIGRYDFNVAGNQNILVEQLKPNVVYLIEKYSIGGNISELDYLGSIVDFPLLTIKRSVSSQIVYQKPIPLTNYADGLDCSVFIHSDKQNDFLTLSLSGVLTQLPSMVGINEVKLHVSFSLYAIDSSYYNAAFRDKQNISIGQANRV